LTHEKGQTKLIKNETDCLSNTNQIQNPFYPLKI